MKNKKLLIGIGVLAAGAAIYYFFFRSTGSVAGDSKSLTNAGDAGAVTTDQTTAAGSIDDTLTGSGSGFHSAGTRKKQVRVNCRVEAKNRGLRGHEKRAFRKECKKNGGFDDGLDNA